MKAPRTARRLLAALAFAACAAVFAPQPADAQCAMCKANVEAAQGKEKALGTGLNTGILYLLAAPYLAAVVVGGLWYRNYRAQKKRELAA